MFAQVFDHTPDRPLVHSDFQTDVGFHEVALTGRTDDIAQDRRARSSEDRRVRLLREVDFVDLYAQL